MVKTERIGILLRRKRTQHTPSAPTFHNINLEFLAYVAVIGKSSQKRIDAGDIFIPSTHVEKLVSQGKLGVGEKLGENHYFIEEHAHGGRSVKEIHQSSFDAFALLKQKNLLPRIRGELTKIVNASIVSSLKRQFPNYKVAFSRKHLSIEDFQRELIKSAKETLKKKPNLLRRRQRK